MWLQRFIDRMRRKLKRAPRVTLRHLHKHQLEMEQAIALLHEALMQVLQNQYEHDHHTSTRITHMSEQLDELVTEVSETKTVVDSAIVLLRGLKEKLDAAGTDPVKLRELSASLNTSQQDLADAITENTPAE